MKHVSSSLQIPQKEGAERILISLLLRYDHLYLSIKDTITPADFYNIINREIYKAILGVNEKELPANLVSIAEWISKSSNIGFTESDLFQHLEEVYRDTFVTSSSNLLYYADQIKETARKRQILDILQETTIACQRETDDPNTLIERITEALNTRVSMPINGKITRLKSIEAADLINMKLRPKKYMLSPWMTEQSLSMLYAPPGTGKTFMSLGIAYAVATGTRFLEWSCPEAAGVLLVDGEMAANTLQDRLKRMYKPQLPIKSLKIITPDLQTLIMPDLSTIEGQQWINQHITDDIKLIIIDNLSTLMRTGKENESESWLPVQLWALRMRSMGKSVLFIHHSGKSGTQRGSSKKTDILDTVIALKKPNIIDPHYGAQFEIHFEKARGFYGQESQPIIVKLSEVNGHYEWHISGLEQNEFNEIRKLSGQGYTQKAIAEELGIHQSSVSRHLRNLHKANNYANKGAYSE